MKKEDVLRMLRGDAFVSGEQIAAALGVSRAAVAKAVSGLRAEGFAIEAVTNRGYRLKEGRDRLSTTAIRAALGAHPWRDRLTVEESVDSTNRVLRRLAEQGAPEGAAVLAETQTAGRGRMGRSFFSAPGLGLYLSVLLRPDVEAERLMTLTARTAVAVSRAIETVCGAAPDVKWVNDLLLGGKKICGILTELAVEAESGRVEHAIVGIGVNCNQLASDFPQELQEIAGSIRQATGAFVDRNRLAAELIRQMADLPNLGWREAYRSRCVTLGKRVAVPTAEGQRLGVALDVGPKAELLVRYDDGTTGAVNSGEVSIRPADGM